MTDAGDVTEDRGFKALFSSYPVETVEVFAPELVTAHGRPVSVEPIQQELPLPDLGEPSRFLDLALLATWQDGTQSVIVLIEHWSEVRRVDLDRVLWYYAALRLRHPQAEVFPVVLVTDPSVAVVPDHLNATVGGIQVLSFGVRVIRIGPSDLPRLRLFQNRVAAVLIALAIQDAVEAAVAAVSAMVRTPGPVDDVRRFLPLAVKLARLSDRDEARFRQRLREEPDMGNMLDEIKVEGQLAEIRRLVARGVLSVDAARTEIEELIATGIVPEVQGRQAIQQMG